ncbi:Sodium-dependent phosphate transport protein 1 [Diplonema papillatum]|nr:Sodium-dependent phosphate transport protein 1 [Diplonema papillatum]|eukprot:gene3724-5791_t
MQPKPGAEGHRLMALFCWLASILCYVDRTNMSVAMVPASKQYGWDKGTQGVIFAGFFVGYASSQVLGGWLSGRIGGPRVLFVAVMVWSFFTVITPACAWSLPLLLMARVGLGIGEGISMPACHAIASTWYPAASVTRYVGFVNSGHHIGTVLSFVLAPFVSRDWAFIFHLFGALGFVWAGIFTMFPPQHAFRPPIGKQFPGAVPWRLLLTRIEFWGAYLSHFGGNFGFYMLITWLPAYFVHLDVPLKDVGAFLVPAYCCSAMSANGFGQLSDALVARGWHTLTVRKMAQSVALGGSAAALLVCTALPKELASPAAMALIFCFALASHAAHYSGNLVSLLQMAPDHAGEALAISNTFATLAGVVGNLYAGFVLDTLPQAGWSIIFLTTVVVYLLTLAAYLRWVTSDAIIKPPTGGKELI